MDDAKEKITEWKDEYNSFRPHSSWGDLTPEEFIEKQQKKPEISTLGCC